MFATNVGAIDRVLRVAVGLAALAFALGYLAPGTGYNALGWLGVVPLATGLAGNCLIYRLLGVSTCAVARAG